MTHRSIRDAGAAARDDAGTRRRPVRVVIARPSRQSFEMGAVAIDFKCPVDVVEHDPLPARRPVRVVAGTPQQHVAVTVRPQEREAFDLLTDVRLDAYPRSITRPRGIVAVGELSRSPSGNRSTCRRQLAD